MLDKVTIVLILVALFFFVHMLSSYLTSIIDWIKGNDNKALKSQLDAKGSLIACIVSLLGAILWFIFNTSGY